METGGAVKTAVFGVGGAGCRIVNMLSRDNPQGSRLVAIDLDKKALASLDDEVTKMHLGESLDDVEDMEEAKKALESDLKGIGDVMAGAEMVIIVAGLGRKTGTYISGYLAKQATDRGILCISVVLFPFPKQGGKNFKVIEAGEAVDNLSKVSNGLVVIDNNLGRKSKSTPMVDVFRTVNSWVLRVVRGFLNSAVGLGPMSMQIDELRFFFHEDLIYVLGSSEEGEAKDALRGALTGVADYTDLSDVQKLLVIMDAPYEVGIVELRDLTDGVEGLSDIPELRWIINTDESEFHVAMLAGVEDAPFLREPKAIIEAIDEGPDEEGEETAGAETKEGTGSASSGAEDEPAIGLPLPGLVMSDEAGSRAKDIRPPALVGLNFLDLPGASEEEPPAKSAKKAIASRAAKKTVKKKAVAAKKAPGAEEEPEDEEALEEMAAELTGFPLYKRKGQKRLSEYTDEYGIEYI